MHDAWEPEWIEYAFVALLRCDNTDCKESVCASGIGGVEQIIDFENREEGYFDHFRPKWMTPSPRMISIPADAVDLLGDSLDRCFSNAWGDYSGAGNHLRKAVEIFVEYLESQNNMQKASKSLHDRIVALSSTNSDISEKLLAIKWVGNSGSHASDLTQNDIFDALDILEWVLSEVFENSKKKIDLLTAQINAKKGPLSK